MGSMARIFGQLFGWNTDIAIKEIHSCLQFWIENPRRELDWKKSDDGLIRFSLGAETDFDYSSETLDLEMPSPRRIVVFACAMASMTPIERGHFALQSLGQLLSVILGWDQERAQEEVNLCSEVWESDGFQESWFQDNQGRFHVCVPKSYPVLGRSMTQ
jgi:hypothetical protein